MVFRSFFKQKVTLDAFTLFSRAIRYLIIMDVADEYETGTLSNGNRSHTSASPAFGVNFTNEWDTFCTPETDLMCADIPLYQCSTCKLYAFWIFFCLILVIALWIVVANSLFISYVIRRGEERTTICYVKASLSVSDILTGILFFSISLPNVAWTVQSTSREIYNETIRRANSMQAACGALFFMLCVTSTLFHLAFMSYNRFASVKWTMRMRRRTPAGTLIKLVLLWVVCAIIASYPAWLPQYFDFLYISYTFTYIPNISVNSTTQLVVALCLYAIISIPYFMMTILTVATVILIRSKNQNIPNLTQSHRHQEMIFQREKSAFKTLIFMELGFTITLLPTVIVLGMTYTGHGNPIAFLTVNYIGMCNSAINVFIYTIRDQGFRKYLSILAKKSVKFFRKSKMQRQIISSISIRSNTV